MAQAFPVFLVIRNSEGEVRWMEVRDWLKRASDNGKKPVKQIVFKGERFDVAGASFECEGSAVVEAFGVQNK